ncbi:MAG TPA: bacillithiol biosynthesis cysteine-adding enzyme BshC [Pyrinomonadaceae bacterium]|nr:bacillithiol biosynthesis cysteine-adding enzyme BshC [Pyrinomonadaceae bacterium]
MENSDSVCKSQQGIDAPFERVEYLPFAQIPHQTRLFLDYLENPLRLEKFYPSPVRSHRELAARIPEVLNNYTVDRNELADALKRLNESYGAGAQTLQNIEKLRRDDCVAVVTGQQAGIFTGALYTIYKALSVIKVAACLNARGVRAVPVFWIATEDHDFEEVAGTFVLNRENKLAKIEINADSQSAGLPVGHISSGESIVEAIEKLLAELPQTQFRGEIERLIRESYKPNLTVGEGFARMMAQLFGKLGLILLDPLDEKLKQLAAPIYRSAVEKSAEITSALTARSRELENSGYHAQILVEDDSFPFFLIDEDGKRLALKRNGGKIKARGQRRSLEFDLSELIRIAENEPLRLSPKATLRATVQDFLLPTVCYFGGAAEVAYFAQTAEVYRILERPVTPIFHRASLTIVEPGVKRILAKYDLAVIDFFTKPEKLLPQIVERFLNSNVAVVFEETEEAISKQLDLLTESLIGVEPNLSDNSERRRRKILWHINALRKKFHRAELQKNEIARSRFETAFNSLYPDNNLQERTLNITSLLARHGDNLIDWLFEAIDADSKEHQVLFL